MASATSTIHVSGVDRREMASLKSRAKAKGLSVEGYVKDLIDSDLSIAELARCKTIDEVFARSSGNSGKVGCRNPNSTNSWTRCARSTIDV